MNKRIFEYCKIRVWIALTLTFGIGLAAFADATPAAEPTPACQNRLYCRIVKTLDAGQNAEGAALTVLHVALSDEKQPAKTDEPQCRPYLEEYWLQQNGKDGKDAYQRLFAFCNDGYGAAGVGEDRITVGPNRITLDRAGGSAWRWDLQAVYQLAPEQPLSRHESSYHTLSGGCLETETAFKPPLQRGWLNSPAPTGQESAAGGCDRAKADSQFLAIPRLADEEQSGQMAATLAKQSAGLGSCALTLTAVGRADAGFVVHGNPDPQARTEMRLLALAPDKLLVQVRDPGRAATVSKNWIHDDRLEVWLGPSLYDGTPADERRKELYQFGVRLADGAVFAGYGKAERLLAVQRWLHGDAQVLLLDWSSTTLDPSSVTVIYGQGDGQKQGRMLATSTLKYGNPDTLGQFWTFPAQCEVQNGLLNAGSLQTESSRTESENTAE